MSHVLNHLLWRTHPMVSKKPTKKLLTFLDTATVSQHHPRGRQQFTLSHWPVEFGKCKSIPHSTHCLWQQPPSCDREFSTEHTPSSVVESLCHCASLSLVKHCQSQATKSHHVFAPLFPFAYLNKPTLTIISVSASTDVTIHCNWAVPGVQQIDTAPFLAEFQHCFPPLG